MEALETRQEIVIQQLKDLKQQLFGMHKELNICCKPAQPTTNKPINVTITKADQILLLNIEIIELFTESLSPRHCNQCESQKRTIQSFGFEKSLEMSFRP